MYLRLTTFIYISLSILLNANTAQAQNQKQWVVDSAFQQCLTDIASVNNWTEPAQFIDIKCNNKDIHSLAGVEKFINVENLSIYSNKLSSIDADLTQLAALHTLNLARNYLASASLNGLPTLQKVYLFGNNIELLTIEALPALMLIKAHNNKITRFTYSDTPKLTKIYVFNNQLEHFDIDHLPALNYMDCRQNPMPDELYDRMDQVSDVTFLHDGNADDW